MFRQITGIILFFRCLFHGGSLPVECEIPMTIRGFLLSVWYLEQKIKLYREKQLCDELCFLFIYSSQQDHKLFLLRSTR